MTKLMDILQGYVVVKRFDRAKYYEKYIRNLIPSSFTITRKDNKIIITVK